MTTQIHDGVAILRVANPPVNALSHPVRVALVAALDKAIADPAVKSILLAGEGATFPAGADIREFDAPPVAPHLPEICARIEGAPKTVVACLHGTAFGGGFELALAAHTRLAAPNTRVGFPEVTLGVIPGAGGTQRLPRIVEIETALEMLLEGRKVNVSEQRELGLVDGIVQGDLISAGVAYAAAQTGPPQTVTRKRKMRTEDAATFQAALAVASETVSDRLTAASKAIVECLEAAPLLPFDQGLALERDLFLELRDSAEAKALRYVFLATQKAARPQKGLPPPRIVTSVAIVGGGYMGCGIAVSCLDAGLEVTIIDVNAAAAGQARNRVSGIYDRAVGRGRLSQSVVDDRLASLGVSADLGQVATADLIIEAIPDDPQQKIALFRQLGAIARQDTVLASNTSYLDIRDLSHAAGREDSTLALHFFGPAHVQRVVEIGVSDRTAPEVEATARAFVRQVRKTSVGVAQSPGLIGNRVLTAYRAAAERIVMAGASPYAVDAALKSYGFKMGPFEAMDLSGLDIALARRQREQAPRALSDALCEAGRFGQKAGIGYYRYQSGSRTAVEDPDVFDVIAQERARSRTPERKVSSDEATYTCLLAMMTEGARLLDEGVAQCASDIDIVMLLGLGFPRHKGGPMKAAELRGLLGDLRELDRRSLKDPFWTPARALQEAVKNGNRFP